MTVTNTGPADNPRSPFEHRPDPLPEPIGTGPARYVVADLSLILDKVDLDLTTHDAEPAARRLLELSALANELAQRLMRTATQDRTADAGAGYRTSRHDHRPGR